jgi:hypothetical protein
MITEIELFVSTDLSSFVIFLRGWMNSEVDKGDELRARILDAAGCTQKREDQL